jgi:hypothetical protein
MKRNVNSSLDKWITKQTRLSDASSAACECADVATASNTLFTEVIKDGNDLNSTSIETVANCFINFLKKN